jgi:hypothetical protein
VIRSKYVRLCFLPVMGLKIILKGIEGRWEMDLVLVFAKTGE